MKQVFGFAPIAEHALANRHEEAGVSVVQPAQGFAVTRRHRRDQRNVVVGGGLHPRRCGLDLQLGHAATLAGFGHGVTMVTRGSARANRRSMLLGRIALITLLLTPTLAHAQVNTEKLRKAGNTGGFSGNINASVSIRSGNVDLIQIGSGFRVQYETLHESATPTIADSKRDSKDLVFLVAEQSFGEKSDDKYINKGFAHARWTRMWIPMLGSEIYGQAEFNEFIRLELRTLGGVGARVRALDTDAARLVAGTGYMLEYEALDEDKIAPSEAATSVNHRWTSYLGLSLNIWDDSVRWGSTVYVQPRLDDFADYRVLADGELSLTVGGTFSLGIAANLRYDSQPPALKDGELAKLDVAITNKVKLSF